MKKERYIVVFVTSPRKSYKRITRKIVELKLAACVNIIEGIRSRYFWEGKICEDKEVLLIIKTKGSLFSKLMEEIKKLHPYKVPEIISLPILKGNREYLSWIKQSTK